MPGGADEILARSAELAPGGDSLARLTGMGEEAIAILDRVEELETELKGLKGRLHEIKTESMPEVMAAAGADEVVVGDRKFALSTLITGSLPKEPERLDEAIKWLDDNGAGGLIKSTVSADFGRDEFERAKEAKAMLDAFAPATLRSGVHFQTLHAFVRERLREGEPLDDEGLRTLNLFIGRQVKITRRAAKS